MLPRRAPLVAVLVVVVACGTQATTTVAHAPRSLVPTVEPFLLRPGPTTSDPDEGGAEVAVATGASFRIHAAPWAGSVVRRLPAANDWGQPLALPVVDARTGRAGVHWLRVQVPERPNGREGWIRAETAQIHAVHERILVDLSDHVLQRWQDGRVTARYRVAVGAPTTPTTPGHFFVWAQVGYDDPAGAYGVFALGLSGFSEVLTQWPGGGRMAIHGTSDPSHLGADVSHGCVRVLNPQMLRLRDVPLGTPVVIRP